MFLSLDLLILNFPCRSLRAWTKSTDGVTRSDMKEA